MAGDPSIKSVSCGAAGNCSAGGYYVDSSGHEQAFVAGEKKGTWGTAREVPGAAALNQGGFASLLSVSCPSAGNCSAGGLYTDSSGHEQAFVVTKTNGTWGSAQEVPGTAALNQGQQAVTYSVSCASAGNCSAGGFYYDASEKAQVFVVSQTNGTWGTAQEVPGTAALNQGGLAEINSVSCGAAGNCTAGGDYRDSSGNPQAFVVSQTNGTWGTAQEVPGTAALNQGGDAVTYSVSCASAGNCSAGGSYTDSSGRQPFAISQVNGTWGTAKKVPGTTVLNKGENAWIVSVSCASAGNCSAGGTYKDSSAHFQVFVVNERNGTWRTAKEVPGTAALNQGGSASMYTVSCGASGNCSAGGSYTDSTGQQAFVVNERNGTWRTAKEVPGTAALNQGGNAWVESLSCPAAGACSAGGTYTDASANHLAFVASEKKGSWGTAKELPPPA